MAYRSCSVRTHGLWRVMLVLRCSAPASPAQAISVIQVATDVDSAPVLLHLTVEASPNSSYIRCDCGAAIMAPLASRAKLVQRSTTRSRAFHIVASDISANQHLNLCASHCYDITSDVLYRLSPGMLVQRAVLECC
jgi:hypothetical protein